MLLDIQAIKDYKIEYGQDYPIAVNLPDMAQGNMFKAVCQMYGLLTHLDLRSKTCYAYTFDKVYANKAIARNWSDKLHYPDSKISFAYGKFAQTNRIKYKETEVSDDSDKEFTVKSEGVFTVDNTKLDSETDLFELPFYAVEDTGHGFSPMAKIRYRTKGEANTNGIPAIVLYITNSAYFKVLKREVTLRDDVANTTSGYMYIASFKQMDAQGLLNKFYPSLSQKMLRRNRVYELNMYLTGTDVREFNHTIPVYLQQYNAYFYVNRIRNHQNGKLTKVEMIKM